MKFLLTVLTFAAADDTPSLRGSPETVPLRPPTTPTAAPQQIAPAAEAAALEQLASNFSQFGVLATLSLLAPEAKAEAPSSDLPGDTHSINLDNSTEGVVTLAEGESSSGGCLCLFDIDRTLTGKQGEVGRCPGNKVLGSFDHAYGGGQLTLSQLGQHISGTFCGGCHIGAISADGSTRGVIGGNVVLGCDGGCKVNAARNVAKRLGVSLGNVWMFDDKASNISPFSGSGMNAAQVSCSSRDGDRGFCGGSPGEVRRVHGVVYCR